MKLGELPFSFPIFRGPIRFDEFHALLAKIRDLAKRERERQLMDAIGRRSRP